MGGGGGNLVPGDLQVWSAEKYSHSLGVFFGALSATARLVCRSGQPKYTCFLGDFLRARFGVFFPAFLQTLPIVYGLFGWGSCGPISMPILHQFNFQCQPRRTWAYKVCRMLGMSRDKMRLCFWSSRGSRGCAGDAAEEDLPLFGFFLESTLCHRAALWWLAVVSHVLFTDPT